MPPPAPSWPIPITATGHGFTLITVVFGWFMVGANRDRIGAAETQPSERLSTFETSVSERFTRIETLLEERLPGRR